MIDLERVKCNPPREMLAVTSRQPTYPSEYTYREGNAIMIAIMGFVMSLLTESLIDIFSSQASKALVWIYLMSFGGCLQIYVAIKDFHHGNTLTASIFFLYGIHWFCYGILVGDLSFIKYVGPSGDQVQDNSPIGFYLISLTLFTVVLTICTYLSPHGSYVLLTTLLGFQIKLVVNTIHCWITDYPALYRISGVVGLFICVVSIYAFIAEALAENGQIIPTGKFNTTKTRLEVNLEIATKKDL